MDINSLLSPSVDAPPSARRASSTSKSSSASSPPLRNPSQPSIFNPIPPAAHARFHPPPPPPAFNELPAKRPELASAHAANAMDALAEAASRQRPEANSFHHHQVRSPSSSRFPRRASSKSNPSPTKAEELPSTSHLSAALTLGESAELCRLAEEIHHARTDFRKYLPYIRMLHDAFVRHRTIHPDPHAFELIVHLRQARDALDNIYPSDEELWIARLGDERSLARSTQDRLAVLKLHALSVRGQPGSVTLWKLYGDYVHYLWSMAYNLVPEVDRWSVEDTKSGMEAFRWDMVVDIWEQASAKTRFHLNNSHLVWDAYTEILLAHLAANISTNGIADMERRFEARLAEPHATWDSTFQAFSTFVTAYKNASYETIMAQAIENSKGAKKMYADRENFETTIQACANRRDEKAEYLAYADYVLWEKRFGQAPIEWVNALYERMTTRFPTNAALWKEYLDTLFQWPLKSVPLTDAAIRATHHCPWSSDLWTICFLAMEEDGCSLEEMERAKHGATMTGLEGEDTLEEQMKVYETWCGYLRRRACAGGSAEEVADREALAEVGFRAAVEYCESARQKVLAAPRPVPDPQYRLELIHISFLTEKGHVDNARTMWEDILKRVGSASYEFWHRYYSWAMEVWAGFAGGKPRDEQRLRDATTILERALHTVDTLDNPEELVKLFLHHCRLREAVQKVHQAVIDAGNVSRRIAERRLGESQVPQAEPATALDQPEETSKRKRADDDSEVGQVAKKGKAEADVDEPKRDREHNVIHMHYLPEDATEADVNRFFRDCGKPRNVRFFTKEEGYKSVSVEFDTHQDALYAQTKVTKPFKGNTIEIEFSREYTIWVANYPPSADEKYLRSLFAEYGEITEVRLPSLQGNTNRRFCYIEFADESSAHKATELDGKVLDSVYRLQVNISDPSKRETRHGAVAEGRELYVKNVDWLASEKDVKELFSAHGRVEHVRIPRNMVGKSKGVAFVVFENQDAADAAIDKLHNTAWKSRTLVVERSIQKPKRKAIALHPSVSASPEPSTLTHSNGHGAENGATENGTTEMDTSRLAERSIAMLNLPDTVNLARLEKLFEPYGTVRKLQLRPDRGGAIVEFAHVQMIGRARLGLEGTELDGAKIEFGSPAELLKHGVPFVKEKAAKAPERKKGKKADKEESKPSAPVRGAFAMKPRMVGTQTWRQSRKTEGGEANGKAKSNADFRALLKGKQETPEADEAKEETVPKEDTEMS